MNRMTLGEAAFIAALGMGPALLFAAKLLWGMFHG